MTTFGYMERPVGLSDIPSRSAVNERSTPGPREQGQLSTWGESGVRSRPHHNEAPPRPSIPGGNAKPVGTRVASPARPTMPVQGRRATDPPATADSATTDTAVLPALPASTPATGFPSRPDPSDPATEIWTLVERAQAGEAEAFGLIYDRYVDTVFRFVYFRVGNRQLAEDLTSDTFLRALKRIGSFTWQGRDLGAWLVTIARNIITDHFKACHTRLEVPIGDMRTSVEVHAVRHQQDTPETVALDRLTSAELLDAIKQLSDEQQECIVLRFLQGFSVAETARAMGKNEGAIKALQYRAVRALARLLPDGFRM
nr:sigma-70 family RNA polymerase sigma factor [Salinispora arenicola]